jgi:hypothetical protein
VTAVNGNAVTIQTKNNQTVTLQMSLLLNPEYPQTGLLSMQGLLLLR